MDVRRKSGNASGVNLDVANTCHGPLTSGVGRGHKLGRGQDPGSPLGLKLGLEPEVARAQAYAHAQRSVSL